MKKIRVLVMAVILCAAAWPVLADMALYVNGGVANLNPTIGINAEFQYGYASVALGTGVMTYSDFGFATGFKGYLFGLDGGPCLEVLYGTTGERANTHQDSNDKTVVDSWVVYYGISALAGWRFFFADGWNMTFGAGAAWADNNPHFIFSVTAGAMVFGDEAAEKNAEKYRKSYEPPEPEMDGTWQELPGIGDSEATDIPVVEMQAEPEWLTPTTDSAVSAVKPVTSPVGTTGAAEAK